MNPRAKCGLCGALIDRDAIYWRAPVDAPLPCGHSDYWLWDVSIEEACNAVTESMTKAASV